jgi:DNA-binding YbaB/EbfC family protein
MALDSDFSLGNLLQKAQEIQSKVKESQAQLAGQTVTASAGGGMVTATVNGAGQLLSIQMEKEIINPEEREMLGDLIVAAVNEALTKYRDLTAQEMSKVTGGLNLPKIFG